MAAGGARAAVLRYRDRLLSLCAHVREPPASVAWAQSRIMPVVWALLVHAAAGSAPAAPSAQDTGGALSFPSGFKVGAGGGAKLDGYFELSTAIVGEHRFSVAADDRRNGWASLIVDRTVPGVISVVGLSGTFALHRRYIATGLSRILVNDTFTCLASTSHQCPLFTNHSLWLTTKSPVVQLNGAFLAPQLSECSTNLVRGTNGNPSAVAARAEGGGTGLMLLDDVSRAHGYFENRATPTRVPGQTPCAISNPPALDMVDPYLALRPGKTFTAEWAIYVLPPTVPTNEVSWAFTNLLRKDLGVNNVTLRGGGTLASWETEILKAGNWSDGGGCSMNASVHAQGSVCWPTWPDATLHAFLRYQGATQILANVMRMDHYWKKCEDNATLRNYCYGSCGTAHQYSNWSTVYMHRLVNSLERINYNGSTLLYLHPFISTEIGAATRYADDRQLDADGSQTCNYAGEFVGTTSNKYGRALLGFVDVAMDQFGFDGIYLDESNYGVTPLDFSAMRDDGHSAIIDPVTYK